MDEWLDGQMIDFTLADTHTVEEKRNSCSNLAEGKCPHACKEGGRTSGEELPGGQLSAPSVCVRERARVRACVLAYMSYFAAKEGQGTQVTNAHVFDHTHTHTPTHTNPI